MTVHVEVCESMIKLFHCQFQRSKEEIKLLKDLGPSL
jgi:hypothetical protein